MGVKKSKNKVNLSLRPKLFGQNGESKPLIIAVVAIVAVLALSLLLLFSDRFVGKAVSFQQLNLYDAGFSVDQQSKFLNVDEVQIFPVEINLGTGKSSVVSFELSYDMTKLSADCSNIFDSLDAIFEYTDEQDSGYTIQRQMTCSNGLITFEYGALADDNHLITGVQTLAEITLTALNSAGQTTLDFDDTKFDVYNLEDSNGGKFTNLNVIDGMIEVVDPQQTMCGDSFTNSGETCDDGNTMDGDGCSSTCQEEPGYTCFNSPNPSVCSICGNGIREGAEQCDGTDFFNNNDQCNQVNGGVYSSGAMGCGNDCTYDFGSCVQIACGDGIKQQNEQCDDSNIVSNDGCSSTCQIEHQCEDTDGGNNHLSKGTLNHNYGNAGGGATDSCKSGADIIADFIAEQETPPSELSNSEDYLIEHYCTENSEHAIEYVVCEAGCQDGACIQGPVTQGTKISLVNTDSGDNFATKITATEGFSGTEIIVWTVLRDANDKVLSIKSEKIPGGLTMNAQYTATSNYPAANVKKKSVLVYDVEQSPTVFGDLTKDY